MSRFLPVALLTIMLTLGAFAQSALASGSEESSLQDNRLLLSGKQATVDSALSTLRSLGVQRVRISVVWDRIAPGNASRTKPRHFQATNPAAYANAGWAPYDLIDREAKQYGIGVNFDLTGGAPLWAARKTSSTALAHVWYPSAAPFGDFAAAVGKRYSGSFKPKGASSALPRVNYWSLWNEPNVGGSSLSPQTVKKIEVGPSLYRGLAARAYASLVYTGHGRDTILVGEMASTGHADPGSNLGMQPLRFLRALFCVGSDYKPLRGTAASVRGCPATASASKKFRQQNPELFNETGWSHHPYRLDAAPYVKSPKADPDWITLADLPRLEAALDKVQRAYGSHRKLSLYLTEYGINTDPPQTVNAFSPSTQAAYLNLADYITWRDPRVASFNQYLLQDSPVAPGSIFSAFASGLINDDGSDKPGFDAYRLPLWIQTPSASRGHAITLVGCVRPAHFAIADVGPATVQIEFQPGSSGPWMQIDAAGIGNAKSCVFQRSEQFAESGSVRLSYTYPANDPTLPAGTTVTSRAVRVTIH
jgi:hypothetical protein